MQMEKILKKNPTSFSWFRCDLCKFFVEKSDWLIAILRVCFKRDLKHTLLPYSGNQSRAVQEKSKSVQLRGDAFLLSMHN